MVFSLILYNVALHGLAVLLLPAWGLWLLLVPKVRAGFWEKLGRYPQVLLTQLQALPLEKRIWVHAVSVGELNAARPLIQRLLERGYPVILSTTTATGHQLARKQFPQLPLVYFPFDFPEVVVHTLQRLRPSLILILETELWPNLLFLAARRNIPVVLTNGRLSSKSMAGYARFKWLFQPALGQFSRLMMQSQADAKRMMTLGAPAENVMALGNLKFDLPPLEKTAQQAQLAELFQFPKHAPVLVFASTHKGEEEIFIRMFEDLRLDFPDLRAVLAPRHPERAKGIATMLTGHGTHFAVRSRLTPEQPHSPETPVILLDTVGELNAVFALSSLACMGGSFIEWGGHNPLEPINAHIPVIFGPSMDNFKDIAQKVLEAHAGFQAQTPAEAEQQIRELLTRPEYYDHIVRNGQKLMAENRGVTDTIVQHLESILTA